MTYRVLHISDLHFRPGWPEEQGLVCEAFFDDLTAQVKETSNLLCIFTGDIVDAGERSESYKEFSEHFIKRLNAVGFNSRNTIFVPGNHDVDRSYVRSKLITLLGLRDQPLTETTFNDSMNTELQDLLLPKFKNYLDWQEQHTQLSLKDSFAGRGFGVSDSLGVYCLNTALFSFGGIENPHTREEIQDEGHLPVETRTLHEWLQASTHDFRILAMHHPPHLLNTWAHKEIMEIVKNGFNLILCGHEHESHAHHEEGHGNAFVKCTAPPLFTRKTATLGYSILDITTTPPGVLLRYRHWARPNFIVGAALSSTDDGVVRFGSYRDTIGEIRCAGSLRDARILGKLEQEFEASLKCYSSLPPIWASRTIADQPERVTAGRTAVLQSADKLLECTGDYVIKAPPQFGLSSLGRYIALNWWKRNPGQFVVVLEANTCENHEEAIKRHVTRELIERGLTTDNLAAIVLDGASVDRDRLINNIKKLYRNVPLFLLCNIKHSDYLERSLRSALTFTPDEIYLWQLDRTQI